MDDTRLPVRQTRGCPFVAGGGAWLVGMVLLWLNGCAGNPAPLQAPGAVAPAMADPAKAVALRSEVQSWLGTPHHMGGLNRRGIDCSGLVVVLYDRLFDIRLPRTTASLMRVGRRVARAELVPGDLVFFKPRYKIRHVGIFLGEDEFVHTSTNDGVVISRMDDDYWRECYLTARRLL